METRFFSINNKRLNFWLFQIIGWVPVLLLFIALFGAEGVINAESLLFGISACGLAVAGSMCLRVVYKKWLSRSINAPIYLLLIAVTCALITITVDLSHYGFWQVAAYIIPKLTPISTSQPYASISAVLFPLYLVWTLLYFVLTNQEKLNQSIVSQQKMALELKGFELENLIRQLDPHFMFNTINNIRALILKDPEKARESLVNFADLMRYQINVNTESTVTIEEEITFVLEYLSLCKLQFGERLSFEVDVSPELTQKRLPRMVIQLLVENAIKHGIAKLCTPGRIAISIHNSEQRHGWEICVSNSGSLSTEKSNSGIGLSNLIKRLDIAFGDNYQFAMYPTERQVHCKISLKN